MRFVNPLEAIILLAVTVAIVLMLLRRRDTPSKTQITVTASDRWQKHWSARDYVLTSGEAVAITQLKQIQDRPEEYWSVFHRQADDNRTLKFALGLLAGYLTMELLSDRTREEELAAAIQRLDIDYNNDEIPLEEADDQFSFESSEAADSAADDAEMQKWYDDLDDTQYFEDMMDD
jgi:hypothetical protein